MVSSEAQVRFLVITSQNERMLGTRGGTYGRVNLQLLLGLVVSRKFVDSALDEDETEFRVFVLWVLLEMLAVVDGCRDQVVEIFVDFWAETCTNR